MAPGTIRVCGVDEAGPILVIVNAAAEAYRGVIPDDCFHEPYMSLPELRSELAAGVSMHGFYADGALAGVMGIQPVGDVLLIRHAYVAPGRQKLGVGSRLLQHLTDRTTRRVLVGTWQAATWAVSFYERHGFAQVPAEKDALLRAYWTVSARQVAASVVLVSR